VLYHRTEHNEAPYNLKEYTAVCKTFRVRKVNGTAIFSFFDKRINELASEGWAVKFSNMSVVQEDPACHGKEPLVAFYALLEREKES
jgi:hypothetical protein